MKRLRRYRRVPRVDIKRGDLCIRPRVWLSPRDYQLVERLGRGLRATHRTRPALVGAAVSRLVAYALDHLEHDSLDSGDDCLRFEWPEPGLSS